MTFDDVRAAGGRIGAHVHRTPVLSSRSLDSMVGSRLRFKCENTQRVGAFKFRGACNAITQLTREQRALGVLAYSSGNHAQAVALASATFGTRAVIVMPSDAPAVKLEATRAYIKQGVAGSRVVLYDRRKESREALSDRIAREERLTLIPPYDHPHIIAGQGTAGLEFAEQLADTPPSRVYVPCGGGGLLSGCAIAIKAMHPRCEVIGVEPSAGDDAARSFRSGRLCVVSNPDTIADGARTPSLGRYTFALVTRWVSRFVSVSDHEIVHAMGLMMSRLKTVVEPTGAMGLAAAIQDKARGDMPDADVGIIISGGNVDGATIARAMST